MTVAVVTDIPAGYYPSRDSKFFGIDIDGKMITKLRMFAEKTISMLGDIARLPFRSEVFDIVTALDVLEHVADDVGALAERSRVLAENEALIITVPRRRIPRPRRVSLPVIGRGHVRPGYTLDELFLIAEQCRCLRVITYKPFRSLIFNRFLAPLYTKIYRFIRRFSIMFKLRGKFVRGKRRERLKSPSIMDLIVQKVLMILMYIDLWLDELTASSGSRVA